MSKIKEMAEFKTYLLLNFGLKTIENIDNIMKEHKFKNYDEYCDVYFKVGCAIMNKIMSNN